MTEYIVEQSKDSQQDWNVLSGEQIKGPYRSLEVANSWAVWFALKDLDEWLRDQKKDIHTTLSIKLKGEAESLKACIETHTLQVMQDVKSMSELTDKSAQLGENYQPMFEKAEIFIVLAVKSPDLEREPDSVQPPESVQVIEKPDKPNGRLKRGRD